MKFGIGQPMRRDEDLRLVTGQGRYTDDIVLPRMAHAFVLRSPIAHARIKRLDAAAARRMPGVLLVLTGEDVRADIEEPEAKAKPEPPETLTKLPDQFDPLGEHDDTKDYKLTKMLGTYMSAEHTADVMIGREVFEKRSDALRAAHTFENRLWTAWKGTLTSADGMILQLATAEELGGRFRGKMEGIMRSADERFGSAGGWEGVKAYVRAKWETTQYLLDKADRPIIEVFRGVNVEHEGTEIKVPSNEDIPTEQFTKLPDIALERNGAQSATTDRDVANNWAGVGNTVSSAHRVVPRLKAPRTACLSVPVYGQNMANEHEVIVAGTTRHTWDAWKRFAPSFAMAAI